jgi:hypothetical protein
MKIITRIIRFLASEWINCTIALLIGVAVLFSIR